MRLSRELFPNVGSHKLEKVIQRAGISAQQRHWAYDDALLLWKFLQFAEQKIDT